MGITTIILVILFVFRLIFKLTSNSNNYDSTPLHYERPATEEKEIIPGNPFYTNAPEHWGIITDEFLNSNRAFSRNYDHQKDDAVINRRSWMVNSLTLMGKINDQLEKKNEQKVHTSYSDALLDYTEPYATSCCIEKLFDKGTISITGIAVDNHKRYAIILFDAPTPMRYIDELRVYFLDEGYEDLIYFAVDDPKQVTENVILKFENFNKSCFSVDRTKQGHNNWEYDSYAMWWVSEKETDFNSAVIKDDIRLSLDLLNFHNSYALGILSFAFGLKDNNNRTRLPDYDEVVILGPEGVQIIITLSRQYGINFHFPMLPKFESYRNKFMKVYVNFCYDIRAQTLEHDLPNDDFDTTSTLAWYQQLLDAGTTSDKDIQVIGRLTKTEKFLLN